MPMNAQEVLDFWFLPPSAEGHGKARREWFRKDSHFDAAIAERFGGAIAQAVAGGLRDWDHQGAQGTLTPMQRWFAYIPFEHAEDARMQEKSVTLFAELVGCGPGFAGALDYAHRHRGVIARFGRFPHRNAILGRASTPEELAFLSQPGSGF
jgi:uncharacterized protein (DUF924 family)